MKKLLSITVLLFTLYSCKKNKDEFIPTTIQSADANVGNQKVMGNHSKNWFSAQTMTAMSLPDISKDASLHESILFGFYNEGDKYGIYSPDNFPKVYGQENWTTRRSVIFRRSAYNFEQLSELFNKYDGNFPVQLILDAWKNGIDEKKQITYPQEGEIWMCRTSDGRYTALIAVNGLNNQLFDMLQLMVWVAK
ncbi:MAG: hypothetical protein J7578_13195 [Chitinophagaceae bacterium]|nr:hypothetical protein [Chitinophagaceae bacterium]